MTSTTITKTVFFTAPRETVWEFLTDKEKLGLWYAPAQSSLVDGAEYTLLKTDENGEQSPMVTGRVLEMDAPNKLVTTFVIGPFEGKETTLTWTLSEAAGGTQLHLTHEGIAEAAGPATLHLLTALDAGWDEHFDSLRKSQMA